MIITLLQEGANTDSIVNQDWLKPIKQKKLFKSQCKDFFGCIPCSGQSKGSTVFIKSVLPPETALHIVSFIPDESLSSKEADSLSYKIFSDTPVVKKIYLNYSPGAS
ncbi:hypothetical protein N9L02_00200 [Gammaproteobacteria bacterium]|nr:hypothetical protein [Gammaproteobacteria bacterium]